VKKKIVCYVIGFVAITVAYWAFPGFDWRHILLQVGLVSLFLAA
jgi:hypothetical protein